MEHDLQAQVKRLEARLRVLQRAHFATLLIIGGAVLVALRFQDKPADVVTATHFKIVDKDGKHRGSLAWTEKSFGLMLANEKGQEQAALTIGPDGAPHFRIRGRDRSNMVSLSVTKDDSPAVSLFCKEKDSFASMTLSSNGAPAMLFRGPRGGVNLGDAGHDGMGLILTSKVEKSAAGLWVTKPGEPKLFLRMKGGAPSASFGFDPDGNCGLSLSDAKGTQRATLMIVEGDTPEVSTRDKDGKTVWKAEDAGLPK